MKEYYKIREMLCKELKEYANKDELSAGSLDAIVKLLKGIKNTYEVSMFEEYEDYDESYDDGGSYARGRGRNAKRDRMGRYSREGEGGGGYGRRSSYARGGGYSRDDGMMYSRDDGREEILQSVREMMREARNDHEREAYRRVLDELENS